MKKSPNTQVRRNGSAARATKQAATVTTSNNAAPAAEPTTLAIICEGREVARIEYSAEEFGRLERARAALNFSLEEFFQAAIKEKLPALEACLGAAAARKSTVPPWLTKQRLAFLKALSTTPTKGVSAKRSLEFNHIAELVRDQGVDLKPGDDMDLVFMAELGWVEPTMQNYWRITPAGRAALAEFTGCVTNPKEVDVLVKMFSELPAPAQRAVAETVNRLCGQAAVKPHRVVWDLDEALNQCEALAILLQQQIITGDGAEWNDSINNGLVHLHAQSFNRLRAAALRAEGGAQ